MCGIIGGVSNKQIAPLLLEGLKRLEYRGYDSAGIAVLSPQDGLTRIRTCGKVQNLAEKLSTITLAGTVGVAHTRWATHGKPSEKNAHPHQSGEGLALVHNGIIENYQTLANSLKQKGYVFHSETDTEAIVHCLHFNLQSSSNLLQAVAKTVKELQGAYALAVVSQDSPDALICARQGSPLVIGVSDYGHFVASDPLALLPVAQDFCMLEEGDIAEVKQNHFHVYDVEGNLVNREVSRVAVRLESAEKGHYRHFMQKEIFEQPFALSEAMEGRLTQGEVVDEVFGADSKAVFERTKQVLIVACGTSYHAGLLAKYWLEQISGISCQVDIASELRYRSPVIPEDTLLVLISQSGETADTLAVLRDIEKKNLSGSLAICNVPVSSLVREAQLAFLTHAGPEIGVASTKAFTTQLLALLMLALVLGRRRALTSEQCQSILQAMRSLPERVETVLALDESIKVMAQKFAKAHHALFLGRGIHYPVVMEGALKLKELSYIHAESYPAGELKHGPLALVDDSMTVVAVVPNDHLLPKMLSNLHEVSARGGKLLLFVDSQVTLPSDIEAEVIYVPVPENSVLSPLLFTIPLQLLAYHVAVEKGTDVDQPRNLAKSVTVE